MQIETVDGLTLEVIHADVGDAKTLRVIEKHHRFDVGLNSAQVHELIEELSKNDEANPCTSSTT